MHIETLRAIDGIGLFPVISLVLFVTVFTVMLVRTFRIDHDRLREFAQLPLADGGGHPEPTHADRISKEN